jgi:dTDP-4-dehydrorhamnose 3,5-epimerase
MAERQDIAGVSCVELEQIGDERGTVLHMLRSDSPDFNQFGECYFSEIFPTVVKAWKCHVLQTQLLAVPVGRVRFVLFDERENSPDMGKIHVIELGRPDNYCRLKIPPGFWYGFKCISEESALLVNCADIPFEPEESLSRNIDDDSIPYQW